MTQTLHDFAAAQMDATTGEYGPPPDRTTAIERWERHLIATCQVPDDILAALPEVSRHNEPQISPQEYECGCVAMTRITDRDTRHDEKPFEMRLVTACPGTACTRAHTKECCVYCAQELYVAADGCFECGGDGEGICSFWAVIGAYQRAGRPEPLEAWLDDWILDDVGEDWAAMGWDRDAHATAIRDHLKEAR